VDSSLIPNKITNVDGNDFGDHIRKGGFESLVEVEKHLSENLFIKEKLTRTSYEDHGKSAWCNPKRDNATSYDPTDVYDVVIHRFHGKAKEFTFLQSFVVCQLDKKTPVCVLTIGKHSYHSFQVTIKELDSNLRPTDKSPYLVAISRLSNNMTSLQQLIPEKVPSLRQDFEYLKTISQINLNRKSTKSVEMTLKKRVQPVRNQPKKTPPKTTQSKFDPKVRKKNKESKVSPKKKLNVPKKTAKVVESSESTEIEEIEEAKIDKEAKLEKKESKKENQMIRFHEPHFSDYDDYFNDNFNNNSNDNRNYKNNNNNNNIQQHEKKEFNIKNKKRKVESSHLESNDQDPNYNRPVPFMRSPKTGGLDIQCLAFLSRNESNRHITQMKELEMLQHNQNENDILTYSLFLNNK